MNFDDQATKQFSWGGFVLQEVIEAGNLFTKPMLLLVLIAIGEFIRTRNKKRQFPYEFPIVLLLFGLVHIALFPRGAYIHDYWAFYASAGIALLAAAGVHAIAQGPSRHLVGLFIAVVFISASLPEIFFYRKAMFPDQPKLGRLIRENTVSGDEVYTNRAAFSARVSYYAQRNLNQKMIRSVKDLENLFRNKASSKAILIEFSAPEARELDQWLRLRNSGISYQLGGTSYRLYRLGMKSHGSSGIEDPTQFLLEFNPP